MRQEHYIALIHKDLDSSYGVSFPDVPGIIAAADTLDEALIEGATALGFAFEDWVGEIPTPRTLEALRQDPEFIEDSKDAVVVAIRPYAAVFEAAQ
jgi:predicted RNase H-like HicB family nuclease